MLFVLGVSLAPAPRLLAATLGAAPLALLGARSLGLYIWHYPVFFWASRQHPTWDWWWRTALAFAITVGFVLVSELLVERRVQQLLRRAVVGAVAPPPGAGGPGRRRPAWTRGRRSAGAATEPVDPGEHPADPLVGDPEPALDAVVEVEGVAVGRDRGLRARRSPRAGRR